MAGSKLIGAAGWAASVALFVAATATDVAAQGRPDPRLPPPPTVRIEDGSFDCLMDAAARVKLSAPIAGVLRAVHVKRGDRVQAGEVVAQLASEVEEANAVLARIRAENATLIGSAEAKLELARRKLGRLSKLRETQIATEKDYDEAVAEAKVATLTLEDANLNRSTARAELKRAEELVAQRRIVSPITGVVVEKHMSPGEYVNDQGHVVSLAAIDDLHVEVYVPVAYWGQVRRGDRVMVSPEEPVGGSYPAEVTIVDHIIDAASATFGVRLRLPNPDWVLPAGLRCRARFNGPARIADGSTR